jgi:ribosomal protein L17
MIFKYDKLLSLNDLFDEIKKSRREVIPMIKSDAPDKKGASMPHSNGIKPTVPANKPVSCPMCNPNVGTKAPEQGEKETFQYMPPSNPFEGKAHHEISLDDIAQGLHRTNLIDKTEFDTMAPEQQKKALKEHAFMHLTPDAKVALHRDIKKIVKPRFESVGRWMQLHRLGAQYDPETLVDDFSHRIIDEMTRHRRTNSKHGYKKEEELQHLPPEQMPPLNYHKGFDSQKVFSDKDIAREARVRTPWWAKRFFFKEAGGKGFEHLIGGEKGPAFQQSQLLGKIYKTDRKIDELKKQAGLATSDTKIDTSVPYSLQDLQQTAKKAGYMLDKETNADGSLKRVLLFEEDPSVLTTIGDDPKYATPKFEVDFSNGGKINDVRDKLATIVNPADGATDTPLHKFIGLTDQVNEEKTKVSELHKQTELLKEKYERFAEEPEVHEKRIKDIAVPVIEKAQNLSVKAPHQVIEAMSHIASSISSAVPKLDAGNFKEAFQDLSKAKSMANSIKPTPEQASDIKTILEGIISLTKEAEQYRDKKTMSPNERENRLDKLFDSYKDTEEQLSERKNNLDGISAQLSEFKDDPQVQQYAELNDRKNEFKQKLETINPIAEKHWQESLSKLNPEGDEEMGDYSDDAQLQAWKDAKNQEYAPSNEIDWDEKIPENFDTENESEATGVGKNILDALKDKLSGHEHFIFGGEGQKKGLVHIAHSLLWKMFTGGEMTKKVEDILAKYPKEGGDTPEFYKENAMLTNQKRWRRLHELDPSIAAKYAILFSDYNPVPYAEPDMYDEKQKHLFQDLFDDLKAKGFTLPNNQKMAQWQYYQMFRILGNHAIAEMLEDKPEQKEIFEKIRSLNKPHTSTGDDSNRYPGKLRRNLERRMDALYGRYAKKFPHQWPHSYEKPLAHWLKKIGVKPEEDDYGKSLIVYSDKLAKADDFCLVVSRK